MADHTPIIQRSVHGKHDSHHKVSVSMPENLKVERNRDSDYPTDLIVVRDMDKSDKMVKKQLTHEEKAVYDKYVIQSAAVKAITFADPNGKLENTFAKATTDLSKDEKIKIQLAALPPETIKTLNEMYKTGEQQQPSVGGSNVAPKQR